MRFEMNTGWKPPLAFRAALRQIPVQVTSTRSIGKMQIVRREVGEPHQLFEAVNNCAFVLDGRKTSVAEVHQNVIGVDSGKTEQIGEFLLRDRPLESTVGDDTNGGYPRGVPTRSLMKRSRRTRSRPYRPPGCQPSPTMATVSARRYHPRRFIRRHAHSGRHVAAVRDDPPFSRVGHRRPGNARLSSQRQEFLDPLSECSNVQGQIGRRQTRYVKSDHFRRQGRSPPASARHKAEVATLILCSASRRGMHRRLRRTLRGAAASGACHLVACGAHRTGSHYGRPTSTPPSRLLGRQSRRTQIDLHCRWRHRLGARGKMAGSRRRHSGNRQTRMRG